MDLDLSDDQVALRDGIASMLEGRVPIERVRAGFDRAMFDELAGAGRVLAARRRLLVGRLRRRLRAARPVLRARPARRVAAARRRAHRRAWSTRRRARSGSSTSTRSTTSWSSPAPTACSVDPARSTRDAVDVAARSAARRSRASTRCPAGTRSTSTAPSCAAGRARRSPRRSSSASPTGCTELAVAYAKEREQFDRPIGSFQAIKHLCADMLVRTEVARAAVYAAGAHLDDARRRRRPRPWRSPARRSWRAKPRSPTASPRRRCSAAWASRGRSTCTST